ncbi:hypothetical protein BJX68DRAFT_263596 [Aspergillus pseudodeflectus]|uniref:SH3 domain-containing protein n=1 Tax=Aspergillus pseudodeflectus TaxID=176178 RepID=A0ABR4KUZ5_9EURO
MAYLSATSPWDLPATAVLLQDAPKRTVDDGMYHPYTSVLDNGVYTAAPPLTVDPANQGLAQQSIAAVDPQASLGLTQVAPSLQAEQSVQTSQTAPTITISITTSIITSTVTWSSTPSPSTTSSHTTSTETTSAEPSSSLAIVPTTTDRVAPPPASPEVHHHAHPLSSIDQAGIALGIMGAALILVALVFWRLERKKRALRRHALDQNDHDDDPTHRLPPAKSYRVYSLASSLYTRTRSTLTLASVAERFKASGGPLLPSIHSRLSDISSHDEVPAPSPAPLQCHAGQFNPSRVRDLVQRWISESSSLARRTLDKIRRLRKPRQTPAQRRSRQPYEYGFCEEYLHIPPPEPTRLERTLGRLWATGSSVMLATTKKLPLPYPPRAHLSPQLSEKGLTGSPSTSSRNSEGEHNSHDGICDRHRQQYAQQLGLEANTSFTGEKDPVRVQCVASSLVTVEESRGQNEDAVSARISGDDGSNTSTTAITIVTSIAPGLPYIPNTTIPITLTTISLVCFVFGLLPIIISIATTPTPDTPKAIAFGILASPGGSVGHLEVSEGDTVRLEQNFDNGWALCTLTTTERQGLLPRAYLSTWPIRTGTTNERLEPSPRIANTPTGLERWRSNASRAKTPTPSIMSGNSQPSRFYSRPETAMSGASGGQDSKAPSMRRTQSLSPTASDASRSS